MDALVGWLGVSVLVASAAPGPTSPSATLARSSGSVAEWERVQQEVLRPLAFPPDSLPLSYDDDIVEDPVCSPGPFARHIVWVSFKPGTTETQREAAVERVDGRVVGGRPLSEQGIYYLFVPDDDVGTGVCRARFILKAMPEVEAAGANHAVELPPGFGRAMTEVTPGPVPPMPPDSIPQLVRDEIYAPRNFVSLPDRSSRWSSRYPRDVVWIQFEDDASQEAREKAVALIGGRVVGGMPLNPGGIYVVRIPHDGTAGPLAEAIVALDSLAQVRFASPDVNTGIRPHGGGSLDSVSSARPRSAGPERRDTTLMFPPDSLPSRAVRDSIYAPGNTIYDARIGWPVPRDIIFLTFRPEASSSQRRTAIDIVRGEVVGGSRVGSGGTYIVRIPHDGTIGTLLRAIETLDDLPYLGYVRPHPPPTIPPPDPIPHDSPGPIPARQGIYQHQSEGGHAVL